MTLVSLITFADDRYASLNDLIVALDEQAEGYRRQAETSATRSDAERYYQAEAAIREFGSAVWQLRTTSYVVRTPSTIAEMEGLPDLLDEMGLESPSRDRWWRRRRTL